ncbi:hypothetical protein BV25DRAFT_901737 [Artomyces pyxidatus]|uniref:Uncharacterized protein n=1 Tax=Artomyces pyxidatus TaxID=48021 RepID=A0ACB8SXA3_9AGAM|nr:hypothetical protein BV25DRAFT_901737 [Artomyces pyxidatus]
MEGRSLIHAPSPAALAIATLHAFLGYYNVLTNGWIHRDVHFGNILLLAKPQKRTTITEYVATTLQLRLIIMLNLILLSIRMTSRLRNATMDSCTAILIDGDNAVPWQADTNERTHAESRSATQPRFDFLFVCANSAPFIGRSTLCL